MKNLKWKFVLFEVLMLSPLPIVSGIVNSNGIEATFIPVFLATITTVMLMIGMYNVCDPEIK